MTTSLRVRRPRCSWHFDDVTKSAQCTKTLDANGTHKGPHSIPLTHHLAEYLEANRRGSDLATLGQSLTMKQKLGAVAGALLGAAIAEPNEGISGAFSRLLGTKKEVK